MTLAQGGAKWQIRPQVSELDPVFWDTWTGFHSLIRLQSACISPTPPPSPFVWTCFQRHSARLLHAQWNTLLKTLASYVTRVFGKCVEEWGLDHWPIWNGSFLNGAPLSEIRHI